MAPTQTAVRTRRDTRRPSDEATATQLKLADRQGDTYGKALQEMTRIAVASGEKKAGDYIVAFAVEHAEGMYMPGADGLEWHDPSKNENLHVEVTVRDIDDGRFLPALDIKATLIDSKGERVATHKQPFIWHPWLWHYGRNWIVPGDGIYTLQVRIEMPEFHRHDEKNGKRYAEPVEVEFRNVKVETGKK